MNAATIANDTREAMQVLSGIDNSIKYTDLERTIAFRQMVASGKILSYVRLLPLILNLNGSPYRLLDHYPFESVFGTYLPPELLMKCARQVSKTVQLSGSSKVWLADGRRVAGEDLVVGDLVQTMTDDFRIVSSRVISIARHAGKPVLRITSRLGTVLEIAETHPLRLLNGWVAGADLRVKDRICAVRRGGEFVGRPQPRARIITTAYLIGDGHISHNYVTLTSMCEEVLNEFSACVSTSRRSKTKSKASYIGTSDKCVMRWLADDDLLSKHSWDKMLPNWVFELSREDTVLFLSRLWATDGMIKEDKTKPQITYCTVCHDLAFQIKSLLAKFGIPCSIKRREAGYTKNGVYKRCRDAFIVRIETRKGWQIFLDTFQVPGKPGFQLRNVVENNNRNTVPIDVKHWLTEIASECRTNKLGYRWVGLYKTLGYPPTYSKLARYIEFFRKHNPNHPRLRDLEHIISGDIIWDEIVAIEPIGKQPCWDVEVEGTHNYILDGIISHNSTSMAARGLAISTAIPHFSTLFITPLYEQIRRFSTNYVRPFIEQSPIKEALVGTSTENSVLQRSFQNFSKMYFSFALTSADRVRGVSAHSCNVDESSCGTTTYVKTSVGKKRLLDIKPGDVVESFRCDGTIVWDPVVKHSYHGYRQCFTIRTSDGCELTATSESVIATSKGWKHVSDLITEAAAGKYAVDAHREPEATCTRHTAGRRKYDIQRECSTLLQSSRLVPARVQLTQVHSLTRIRTHTSIEEEEWRLRRVVERLRNCDFAGLRLYRGPVLPERQEVCESELAGSIDLGRDRLVDRRRRQLIQPQPDAAHTGLFHDGSRPVSQLADGQGRTLHPLHDKIEDERQATLLHNGDESGHREANWRSKNLLADLHALQAHTAANDICSNMPVLQRNISAERVSAFRSSKVSRTCVLLPGKGLSESAWARGTSTIHQSARQERATQCSWQGTLLPELGGFKNPTPEAPSQLHGKSSRGIQQTQTDGQSRSQSSQAESATYLRDMPRPIREDEQGRVAEVLPYLQTTGDTSEQSEVRLEEVSIESIKYAGYRHVYDIETALNHTFIANNIAISNCQDMDPNLIPIIKETMSASKWRLSMYTGTPKTLDNTIEGLWQSSSQAEWCIPCMNCKKLNVPHMGMDLEKMIGPNRDDICDDNPAVICAKCRLPINPRKGRWMHKFKERRFEFPGYHIPQIVMPIHYSSHKRWGELLAKQQGYGNYTIPQFYNEVLGESYDVGAKLLTKTDLENASVLPWANEPLHGAEAVRRKEDYVIRVLGVDWGGGGELRRGADKKKTENITMSFTCAAVVGLRGDGRLDVIYGRRLLTPHDHMEEAKQLMRIYQMFDCQLMAHDYNGAGALRETIVVQSGVPLNRVVPIVYTRSAWQNIMNFHRSEDKHSRNFWLVDKARSLQLLCQCIKMVQIRLFKHDYVSEENRGLQHDFLSLMENKVETARGPDIYTIQRNPHFPDDFAHAVNFAACALWNETKSWPNVAELAHLKMTVQQMNQINPVRPWLEGGYLGQP